ncbi:DUF6311 domain-containing protein [Sphingomonas bacterium]|uniref:DUF6311 domain-containing protein n=1 Tax=Sphingomonas bacterium TaxID=1895847 RepID=UPI00262745FD|nr:DUF6311 domain-containing protein [Sphingomonas bacterium]
MLPLSFAHLGPGLRRGTKKVWNALPFFALAVAMFVAWMHPAILDPRNVGWLLDGSDRGQNSMGLIAYLRGGTWPGLHDPMLMAPEGLPLALTDSNPLLGLLLGLFGLPVGWQVTGLWLFACIALQVIFARALVTRYVADPLAAFLGTALLAVSPALIARYGHVNLCAHWLILWALWVFVDPDRARRPGWWAAVLGVALLVHPYLTVMAAAIWASAVLRLLVVEPESWRRTVVGAGAVTVLLVGIAWWLGFIGLDALPTGSYGQFGMALDALWNPGNSDYSALLPGLTTTSAQGFEGLNYLGAGLLALAVVACVAAVARRERLADLPLFWLVPAFLVLTLVAIGPHWVWRGQTLMAWPLPDIVRDALDPVRAGGRLFWPVGYVIALAAIVVASRLPRASLILGAALALQLFDLAPMVSAVRATSASAGDQIYRCTRDPAWAAMVARASAIEFEPATPYLEEAVRDELTWRAITAPRPVPLRYFYASREPAAVRKRLDADTAAFQAGRIDPTRLYVILDNRIPLAVMNRIQLIDGIAVIPPVSPSSPR